MGQVTIYLDDETERELKKAAKAAKLSRSKWVARIVRKEVSTSWPADLFDLKGDWSDFPSVEELRKGLGVDAKREW